MNATRAAILLLLLFGATPRGETVGSDSPATSQPADAPVADSASTPRDTPGFTGSAHDFLGRFAPPAERCAPCHGPEASPPIDRLPRFRSDAPQAQRLAATTQPWRIADTTALCLSCHDGTLASAVDSGDDGRDRSHFGPAVALHRDHPVGVPYPRTGRTRAGTRRDYVPIAQLEAEGRIHLPGGRVECVSCHEPHNAYGVADLLVKPDRRSALCLSCHVK